VTLPRIKEGRVVAVCIGDEPGPKREVSEIELVSGGVVGDCHFGGAREVSVLPKEALDDAAKTANRALTAGTFAENILTEGIDWARVWRDSLVVAGDVVLEPHQRGKEHCGVCSVAKKVGFCIGDEELVFCRVLRGGRLKVGMRIKVVRADVWNERVVSGELGETARFLRRRLRKTHLTLFLLPQKRLFVIKGQDKNASLLVESFVEGRFGVARWEELDAAARLETLQRGICVYRRGL